MSECILQASGIRMAYKNRPVLGGVDLRVNRGEICGLLGPNGAGKTTLLKILTGLTLPDAGDVALFGRELRPPLLRRVGSIIQKQDFYGSQTVAEALRTHQMLLGIPDDRTDRLLETVGLKDEARKKVSRLSTGMRQRLAIAMALSGKPDLLLLDEPVNGLDVQGMYDIRETLHSLNREGGVTILITSHLLDEVSRLATCYALLRDGVIRQVTGEEVQRQSRHYAEIIVNDGAGAAVVLDRFVDTPGGYEVMPDSSFRLYTALDRLSEVNRALVLADIAVENLSLKSGTLVDFYLSETGKGEKHA